MQPARASRLTRALLSPTPPSRRYWGLAASYFGIWLFFVGLTHGLSKIAFEAGSILPSAFTKVEGIESSPIWSPSTGKFVVMTFAFSLGFCATLAGEAAGWSASSLVRAPHLPACCVYF